MRLNVSDWIPKSTAMKRALETSLFEDLAAIRLTQCGAFEMTATSRGDSPSQSRHVVEAPLSSRQWQSS
jgi:hypothetical protein